MLFHPCRYQCIENDLLYPLQRAHNIAPYKSKGLERASELEICWDSDESLRSMNPNNEESCPPWNSIASRSGICYPQKLALCFYVANY